MGVAGACWGLRGDKVMEAMGVEVAAGRQSGRAFKLGCIKLGAVDLTVCMARGGRGAEKVGGSGPAWDGGEGEGKVSKEEAG